MKEKLQEYALLAEIIGGIAIVASLIFVGLQIKQNSKAQLAVSRQDLLEADITLLGNMMLYPQLWNSANHGNLTGEDATRRDIYYVMMLRIREFAWEQYNNGVLDEKTLNSYLEPLKFAFGSDTGHKYLLSDAYNGDPKYEEYVIDYLGLQKE